MFEGDIMCVLIKQREKKIRDINVSMNEKNNKKNDRPKTIDCQYKTYLHDTFESINEKNNAKNDRPKTTDWQYKNYLHDTFKDILSEIEKDDFMKNDKNKKYETLGRLYGSLELEYINFNESKTVTFEDLKRYFLIFDKLWQPSILQTIKENDKFEEIVKLAINCWCVSVNLASLYLFHSLPENNLADDVIKIIIGYLDAFHSHVQSNGVARRLVEVVLYCLCNACKSYKLSNEEILEKSLRICFSQNLSLSIKIASGIILSFKFPSNPIMCDVFRDLECLKLEDETYLGIDKLLITEALNKLRKRF